MPCVILHGGAGSPIDDPDRRESVRDSLEHIRSDIFAKLIDGSTAREAAVFGCERLENDPEFNAGLGSKVQADGRIRMSASLMDGHETRFSGAIQAEDIRHPVRLADALQSRTDRVLTRRGLERLARELDLDPFDPTTLGQLETWYEKRRRELGDASDTPDGSSHAGGLDHDHHGTVGVATLDEAGRLAVATSTGGRGHERAGRVSDSSMPAGNYATDQLAVSCTGVGEDIIDEALAPRLAVRVTDGARLDDAFTQTFDEAQQRERSFGAIALHADGHIAWGKTTGTLLAAWRTPDTTGHALGATTTPTVQCPDSSPD
jgi:L-asparaginase